MMLRPLARTLASPLRRLAEPYRSRPVLPQEWEPIPYGRRYRLDAAAGSRRLDVVIPSGLCEVSRAYVRIRAQTTDPEQHRGKATLATATKQGRVDHVNRLIAGTNDYWLAGGLVRAGDVLTIRMDAGLASGPALVFSGVTLDVIDTEAKTADYIKRLDIAELANRGIDYRGPQFSLDGLPSLDRLHHVYDYRFDRLLETEDRLRGVDRKAALRAIFDKVTAGAESNAEKHHRIVRFIQRNMFGNVVQAMYPDKSSVLDPLLLLELSEYRCGTAARVGIDLFASAGFEGRLLLVAGHVLAEVFYDGGWHIFEPTYFEDGLGCRAPDGSYPSFEALSRQPWLVDAVPSYLEPGMDWAAGQGRVLTMLQARRRPNPYPSRQYYYDGAYRANGSSRPTRYAVKLANALQEEDRFYGWRHYKLEVLTSAPRLSDHDHWLPAAPMVKAIHVADGRLVIEWEKSDDRNGDIVDYRVFVGSTPRGWNYPYFDGPPALADLATTYSGDPEAQYVALNRLPPADVADIVTSDVRVELPLPKQTVFVTVMARDRYGLAIGRELFLPSNEFRIEFE